MLFGHSTGIPSTPYIAFSDYHAHLPYSYAPSVWFLSHVLLLTESTPKYIFSIEYPYMANIMHIASSTMHSVPQSFCRVQKHKERTYTHKAISSWLNKMTLWHFVIVKKSCTLTGTQWLDWTHALSSMSDKCALDAHYNSHGQFHNQFPNELVFVWHVFPLIMLYESR